jgi:O-antigen ligase
MSIVSRPPTPPGSAGERLDRIGIFGAYLFALFALLGISVALVGLLLFVLVFLVRFREWRLLAGDPLAILCLLLAAYLGLHSLVFFLNAPTNAFASEVVEAGGNWAKLVLLVPFAYWASGNPEHIRRLLLCALLGFVLGFLRKIDWYAFDASFFLTRFDNHLPSNAFGMFAALGALGLFTMRHRFWGTGGGLLPRWTPVLLWILLLAVLIEGLMLSFSRGAWLAFLIAATLLLRLELRQRLRGGAEPGGKRRAAAVVLALAISGAILVYASWDQIRVRIGGEGPVIAQVIDGDLKGIQHSSIGIRILGWRYGLEEWRQHPWLGLGAGTTRHRIADSGRAELKMYDDFWLPHLHNTYLEILYQLGLVGLILLVAMVWVLVRGLAVEYRAKRVPKDLCRFLLVTLVFVLVWNLFEYRAVRHDWRFFWIIFAGIAYSFRLRTLLTSAPASAEGKRPRQLQ